MVMRLQVTHYVDLTVQQLAKAFADMGAESQARFFCEVSQQVSGFGAFTTDQQVGVVAAHLSDELHRLGGDLVLQLADAVRKERADQ
jgi:hypothetical protein